MKFIFVTSFLFSLIFIPSASISMMGISIHEFKSKIVVSNLKVSLRESNRTLYETNNHNTLILTFRDDKIIQLENDWSQSVSGSKTLYSDFEFGKTSYQDIKNRYGTSGFQFKSMSSLKYMRDTLSCNCFEFNSPNKEILVLISKTLLRNKYNKHLSDSFKLDKIIIADKDYLNEVWGNTKLYEDDYKLIQP